MGPRANRFALWARAVGLCPALERPVLRNLAGREVQIHGSQCEPWPELPPQPHRPEHFQRTTGSTGPLLSPGFSFCFGGKTLNVGVATSAVPAGSSVPACFTILQGSTVPAGSNLSARFFVPAASTAQAGQSMPTGSFTSAASAVPAVPKGFTSPFLIDRSRRSAPPPDGYALWFRRTFHAASLGGFSEGESSLGKGASGEFEAMGKRSGDDKEQQSVECSEEQLACEEEGGSIVARASRDEVQNRKKKGRPRRRVVSSFGIEAESMEEVVSAACQVLPPVKSCLEAVKGPEGKGRAANPGLLASEGDRRTDLAFSEAKLVPSEDDRAVVEALEKRMKGKKGRKKGLVALEKKRVPCEEGSLLKEVEASQDADVERVGSEESAPKVDEDVVLRNLAMLRSLFSQQQLVQMAESSRYYKYLMKPSDHVAARVEALQSWNIHTPSIELFYHFMRSNIEGTLRPKWEFLMSEFGEARFKAMARRCPVVFQVSRLRMRQSLAVLTKELGSRHSALEVASSNPGLLATNCAQLAELLALMRAVCGLTMDEIRESLGKSSGFKFYPVDITGSAEVVWARLGSSTLTSIARRNVQVLSVDPKSLPKRLDVLEEILGKEALPSALARDPEILLQHADFLTRNMEFIMSMDDVFVRDEVLAAVQREPSLLRVDWANKGIPVLEFLRDECGIHPADVPLSYWVLSKSLEERLKPRCRELKQRGWRIVGKSVTSSRGRGLKHQGRKSAEVVGQGSKGGGGAEPALPPSGPSMSLSTLATLTDVKFQKRIRKPLRALPNLCS